MDFLKSHTFISLFIASLYFIIKTLLNKLQKEKIPKKILGNIIQG